MTPGARDEDHDLLLAIRTGDEQAFVSLYRKRQGAIYRFALNMTGEPALAEDVTQEVFLALIRDEWSYDPERGALASYLFGIARKLVLRSLERGRGDLALDSAEQSAWRQLTVTPDPLSDLTRREGIEALRRAVLTLPRRYREVVVLCDLEEVDYADAARILGCPVGTVRSRLHRARALLMEKLVQERNPKPALGTWKAAKCLT
jgi:RNA polymerase sigma-70 factor (ECF subfamily)